MISYLSHKYPDKPHDQIVAIAASECGVSRKNDIGLDAGIRAALHLAHYKEKYPHLTLHENLAKAYHKIMMVDDMVSDMLENGQEQSLDEIFLQMAVDFEDLNEESHWVTIKGRHVFIKKGQSISEALNEKYILPKNTEELEELIDKLQQKNNFELYVRGSYSKSLKKEKSLDLFIQHGYDVPKTREEAEDLMDRYDLWDIADIIDLKDSDHPEAKRLIEEGGSPFAIQYNGVNALQEYDKMMMSHFPYIYVFKGKYLGQNASGDGDIIDPNEIIAKIKNPNYKRDLIEDVDALEECTSRGYTEDIPKKPGRPKTASSRAPKAGTPPALVGGAKRTTVGQSLKEQGIPMTVEGPESVTLPFKIMNTETGELVEGEMVENLDKGTAQMQPVSSSNVRSVGQAQNELVVAFHSTGEGRFYRFKFSDQEMATEARNALLDSSSPGRWIWHNIRGHIAGEPVTSTKLGPAITSGKPTIGGTSASLVQYSTSKTAPSRVVGYKEAYEKLQRQTSNPSTDPSTGARIEGLLGARKGFRELGRKIRQDFIKVDDNVDLSVLDPETLTILQNFEHSFPKAFFKEPQIILKKKVWAHNNEQFAKVEGNIIQVSAEAIEMKQYNNPNWKEEVIQNIRHEIGHQIYNRMSLMYFEDPNPFIQYKGNLWNVEVAKHYAEEQEKYNTENWRDQYIFESNQANEFMAELLGRYYGDEKSRSTIKNIEGFENILKQHSSIGKGWWGESERHSRARKFGKADFHACDFTMEGLLTRSGEFDYRAEGQGIKIKTPENLKWIAENTDHVPVFGKRERGAHQESETSLVGFAHKFKFIPIGEVDDYAHIYGEVELFKDIKDLSSLEDPRELPVSFGFDDIGEDYVQKLVRLHHLAISLDKKERDRCSTMGGTSCNISPKKRQDMTPKLVIKPLPKITVSLKK